MYEFFTSVVRLDDTFFKYGNLTASSTGVESSFKKLKVVTFKDINLPTNTDLFLERHVISL